MGNRALRTVGTAVAIGLVATMSLGSITGCAGNKANGNENSNTSQSSKSSTDWKNATAATFNGTKRKSTTISTSSESTNRTPTTRHGLNI
mgnify:CR=1 FL=1